MTEAEKVLAIALGEVGYLEKETSRDLDHATRNAGDENYTKYARDLDAMHFYNSRKNGHAWCDVFVDWCFVQVFGEEGAKERTFQPRVFLFNKGAGCRYSYGYYGEAGRTATEPQPGDQIFFTSGPGTAICHTGLVYRLDETYVYTVEGNTSEAAGVIPNGGTVAKKQYRRDDSRIAGYGRPAYRE